MKCIGSPQRHSEPRLIAKPPPEGRRVDSCHAQLSAGIHTAIVMPVMASSAVRASARLV